MNDKQLAELLDRYIKGLCTAEEAAVINKWYNKYQHEPDVINSFTNESEHLRRRMLDHVLNQINPDHDKPLVKNTSFINRHWPKLAVAAVLLISLKIFYTNYWVIKEAKNSTAQTEIVNNTKHIIKQVLPDRSIVWLNPEAVVRFPEKFKISSRDISMEGECFFEVTKNPQRPFVIQSKHLVTKVWGTTFKVSDNNTTATAQVTVVTGKVSVSIQGSKAAQTSTRLSAGEVILLPKQKAILKTGQNIFYTDRKADVSDLNIYKHINLLFENARLSMIVAVLKKKFDANIRIENKELDNKVMDADLTGLNLPEVLEVLKASLQLDYEVKEDFILLEKPIF